LSSAPVTALNIDPWQVQKIMSLRIWPGWGCELAPPPASVLASTLASLLASAEAPASGGAWQAKPLGLAASAITWHTGMCVGPPDPGGSLSQQLCVHEPESAT
jgi:hypothetical protein